MSLLLNTDGTPDRRDYSKHATYAWTADEPDWTSLKMPRASGGSIDAETLEMTGHTWVDDYVFDLATAKKKAEDLLDSTEAVYRAQVLGAIDPWRVIEYVEKIFESAAVQAIADLPQVGGTEKVLIPAQAARRSTDEATEAARIKTEFDAMRNFISVSAVARVAAKDAVTAATDQAGIDAAVAAYITEMDGVIAAL